MTKKGPGIDDLIRFACTLLPSTRPEDCAVIDHGGSYDVVIAPGTGAVRMARSRNAAEQLRRTVALTQRLAEMDLPLALPTPLGPVVDHRGRAAVATAWVPGEPAPRNSERVHGTRHLLNVLADVDTRQLTGLLAPAHSYAGGAEWRSVLEERAVPLLPARWRPEAIHRIEAVASLPPARLGLVHGDLAGSNVLWQDDTVVGVLDWDLASRWDPAVDAACLAWHGWGTVRQIVSAAEFERAVTWYRVFGLEQISHLLTDDGDTRSLDNVISETVEWLERTTRDHPT